LEISIATRDDEIRWYANHPDPNMRALAGDPGHIQRLDNELEKVVRCRDDNPECDKKPKDVPFVVPQAWRDPAKQKAAAGATAAGIGGALIYILIRLGWLFAL
jgi:hypothetical protein